MSVPTDKVVMTMGFVTVGSTVAAQMLPKEVGGKGQLPSPKLLFGAGLTFSGLSMLGDFAPGLAKSLSAAIGLTALTYYGFPLMDNWFNDTHKKKGNKKNAR